LALYEQGGLALLVGSNRPLAWRPEEATARLTSAFSRAYYARASVDVAQYLDAFARLQPTRLRHSGGPAAADLNRDLFPRDEFRVPHAR